MDRRLIVISDIHGNLKALKGLLDQVDYSEKDLLILNGDLLEKGPDNLGVLRLAMKLGKTGPVYAVAGNCDMIYEDLLSNDPQTQAELIQYMRGRTNSWVYEMCRELGQPNPTLEAWPMIQAQICEKFAHEIAFVKELPDIIETQHITFVHSGLEPGPLEEQNAARCRKNNNFYQAGHSFSKYTIVGHMPVCLYRSQLCHAPIINQERKIICIDGGNRVKSHGQLNALLLQSADCKEVSFAYFDELPVFKAEASQPGKSASLLIRWPDLAVEVLSRGDEFSRCRHRSTGKEFWVLSNMLWEGPDGMCCRDVTNEQLEVKAGDKLSLIASTSRGHFVKKDCVCGWYFGSISS